MAAQNTEKFTGLTANHRYTLAEGGQVIGGINEQRVNALHMYPNPATNELRIKSEGLKINELKIYMP